MNALIPQKLSSFGNDKTARPGKLNSGFESASWEIVGDADIHPEFEMVQLQEIAVETQKEDPLFKPLDSGKRMMQAGVKYKNELNEQPKETMMTEGRALELIAEAEVRGRASAQEEAKAQREAEIKALEERFELLIQSMSEDSARRAEAIEKASLMVALELSKKIIEQAVEINPEYIVDILKQAIQSAGSASIKKVKVSPQDLEFIEVMGLSKKFKEFDGAWNFEADGAVKSGCVIETSAGEVDFNLEKSWERIAESVVRLIK